MRLTRKGMNVISCVFDSDDMVQIGCNPDSILNNPSVMSEELQILASFIMHVIGSHIIPLQIPIGLPLEVNAAWGQTSIELQVSAPLPFELFDFPYDYDEEIDLSECNEETCEDEIVVFDGVDETEEINAEENETAQERECVAAFCFNKLDDVIQCVKMCGLPKQVHNMSLYKDEKYWLICSFLDQNNKTKCVYLLSEWCWKIEFNKFRITHITEHGKCVANNDSIKMLLEL